MEYKYDELKKLIQDNEQFQKDYVLDAMNRNYSWYNGGYYKEFFGQSTQFKYNLNTTYSTTQVIVNSIYSEDPSFRFKISSDINRELRDDVFNETGIEVPVKVNIPKLEFGLEYYTKCLFNELKSRKTNKRVVVDSVLAGFGCTKIGYIFNLTEKGNKALTNKEEMAVLANQLDYSEIIEKDSPFKVRVNPRLMIFPYDAPSLYELPWECEILYLTPEKVKKIYGKDVKPSSIDFNRTDGRKRKSNLVKLYEFHNLDTSDPTIYTLADGHHGFLDTQDHPLNDGKKVKSMYQKLWFNDGTECVYPLSDISIVEDQIKEVNQAVERRVALAKKNRAILKATGNWAPEQLLKYEIGVDGDVIHSMEKDAKLEQLAMAGLGQEFFNNIAMMQGEILSTLGLTDYAVGGATQKRKATEAQIMERSRLDRVQNRITSVEEFVYDQADCVIEVVKEYNVIERTFTIVYGKDDIVKLQISGQFLKLLDSQIQVVPGSTVSLNSEINLKKAMSLAQNAQAFPGIANMTRVWKEIVKNSGYADAEEFTMGQDPAPSVPIGNGSQVPGIPGSQGIDGVPSPTPFSQGNLPNQINVGAV